MSPAHDGLTPLPFRGTMLIRPTIEGKIVEWLLVALLAGGGGFAAKRWRERVALDRENQEELQGVQRLADEDVTILGEQLQRLDGEVAGREMDEPTRVDYQTALDSYESAQRAVPRIRSAAEISKITDTLATGRYALACVQARVSGQRLPELRVPCFFNPQHGPSVTDVMWTQRGRGTRTVPACAQDAARVAKHDAPEVRMVKVGSRTVPYWEAGDAFLPYSQGYFASAAVTIWTFQAQAPFWSGEEFGAGQGGGAGFDGGGGFDGGFDGGGGGGGNS
ncbi:MAG: hypothetical protein WKF72_10525 [Nocardioidaceae bacterium]